MPTVEGLKFSYGLHELPPGRAADDGHGDLEPGSAERLAVGSITCLLVPRALELPTPAPSGL